MVQAAVIDGGEMSEASDRVLMLLQELALLEDGSTGKARVGAAARLKRRKQITEEIRQIANEKKKEETG
jgi:hypothetical protein